MASADVYTCAADGHSDCPCHTSEKARPPPEPKLVPLKVELAPGEAKYICSCGASKNFPFCDGSHKEYNTTHGTSFVPIKLSNETAETAAYWLCQCGHSAKRSVEGIPLCDGAHKRVVKVGAASA